MSMHDDILKVLVSEEELKAKVAELGAQISKDYEGRNLVLVSILKGSVVFMADLMRAVSIPVSYTHLDVYKRQVWGWLYSSHLENKKTCCLHASMTHQLFCSQWF